MMFTPEQITQWPLDRLFPYAKNARTHSEEQVAQIAASMAEFGFTNPCLVDEHGVLITGHGQVLAARMHGLETVPVIVQAGSYTTPWDTISINSPEHQRRVDAAESKVVGHEVLNVEPTPDAHQVI